MERLAEIVIFPVQCYRKHVFSVKIAIEIVRFTLTGTSNSD